MLLTNASVQIALRTMRVAEANLDRTQGRISTGLKVAKADDNPAFFLVAATQKSDMVKIEGARENLNYALGAVRTAMSAQVTIDDAIQNIRSAIITLENGVGRDELSAVVEEQVEMVRSTIMNTEFNGLNLLAERNMETVLSGIDRGSDGQLDFNLFNIFGAGLAVRRPAVSSAVPPLPGATLDLNSQIIEGAPGALTPRLVANANGVNVGPGLAAFPQKTFAISFETGSDITNRQIIYEQGGGVRGLNIYVENEQLVFGAYNLAGGDPSPAWPWREVRVDLAADTRYTAQLVLDGNTSNTGSMRAYLDGQLLDTVNNVGVLYEHPGGIGVGRVNGNAVLNGSPTGYSAATEFTGFIDKVVQYNEAFTGPDFDAVTTYLAEGWLPERKIAYYVGSSARQESATLVDLLEAIIPLDQEGFSTQAALELLDTAQRKSNRAFSLIGFFERRIERQQGYLSDLGDSIGEGVAALIEADLAEESAQLQAFQVQGELARESARISNGRPSLLLQLFN